MIEIVICVLVVLIVTMIIIIADLWRRISVLEWDKMISGK